MIRLGKLKLDTAVPDDLDAKLVETTGCVAAEVRRMLAGSPMASMVARALHPFVAEAVDLAELTERIARAGVGEVKAAVIALYDDLAPPAEVKDGK